MTGSAKSDSFPPPEFLKRRQDWILACWQLEHSRYPDAFEQEVRYDLVGFEDPAFLTETALQSLSKRCATFSYKNGGYDSWEKK